MAWIVLAAWIAVVALAGCLWHLLGRIIKLERAGLGSYYSSPFRKGQHILIGTPEEVANGTAKKTIIKDVDHGNHVLTVKDRI